MRIEKLYKNKDFFPIVKGTETNLFINPIAAILKTQSEKIRNTGKSVDELIETLTYDDGKTELTKGLKAFIKKEVVSLDQMHYSREFNERDADIAMKKIFTYVDLFNDMTFKTTARDDWNLQYTLYNSTNLYNSVMAGAHPTERATMPYKIGKYGRLRRFEQKWTVTDDEIVHNMYDPNFMSTIAEAKLGDWFDQLNEVFTIGAYNASGYAVTNPATGLMNGLETLLINNDGTYTNRDGVSADPLMGRKYLKPLKLDVDTIIGSDVDMSELTGAQIYEVLDAIVEKRDTIKPLAKMIRRAKIYMDSSTAHKYMEFRGEPVSSTTPNNQQENYRSNGGVYRHKGYLIETLYDLSGSYIIFGDMSEYFGFASSVFREIREYEPELSGGGSGFVYYRKGWMGAEIRDAMKFIVVGDFDATASPMILDAYNINATDITGETSTTLVVYPVATTLDTKMYYTDDGSEPDNTDTEIAEGSSVTLTSGDTIKVVAYQGGNAKSAVVEYTVS